MRNSTPSTAVRSAPKVLLGITERGLQRKLLVAYALTFVLPTAFCLVCVAQLAVSGGVPFMTKLGLLIGLPSVTAMSVGGFMLLRDPLRCVERLSADVEAVASESAELGNSAPHTWDEAHRAAHFVTHVIDDYRTRLSTLGTRTRELQETNQQLRDVALTVSIGVGAFTGDVVDSNKVIELAESSLSIARRTGANMVWA